MHKIQIPRKIIDACIAKRGGLHVFDDIDPRRTALIVVDMQNAWVGAGVSPLEIPMAREIIPNVNRLASSVRATGGLVAWTQSTFTRDLSSWYERFGTPQWRQRIIADTAIGANGHRIHADMDVHAEDLKVVKTRPSAFIQGSSELEALLRARGRDILIITGTLTNACCESSARDAAALGFSNIFVADATATRTDEEHNATLTNLIQYVADVMLTDEVVALLRPHIS